MTCTAESRLLPVLGLTLNALVFGLSWWPFKEMQRLGLHPLWATCVIYLSALLPILYLHPRAWRGLRVHPELWILFVGAGLTNIGFNWAVTIGDVVRVVLLFYLMPAWSILIAWVVLRERPHRAAWLRLLLAMAGVTLVLKTPDTPWPLPQSLPDYLALLGGCCFALTNAMLRRLHAVHTGERMFAMFGGGALMTLVLSLAGVQLQVIDAVPLRWDWVPVALALMLSILLTNWTLQYGAARLPAHTTALVMLSEVVFASLSSVALGAAELNTRTLLGGGLIVLAAALAAWPYHATSPATPEAPS